MFRRSVAVLLSVCLLLFGYGCTSTRVASINDYQQDPRAAIERVILADGTIVEFDAQNGMPGVMEKDEIVGCLKYSNRIRHIPASQVRTVYYSEPDAGKSAALGIGILAGAVIVGAIIVSAATADALGDAFGK